MKYRLLFFIFLVISSPLLSQKKLIRDSALITIRSLNATELKELKKQREFQYNMSAEPPLSLWDKFWNWLWWKVGQLLGTKGRRTTAWSVLVLLGVIVIIYFLVKITGMDQGGLFGRSQKSLQQYTLSQDDIHAISFDEAIEKAVGSGNYRLATRLYYLQALKKLSDKGYIDWRINKTNTDYLAEISGKPFADLFSRLTIHFEYTWYGVKKVNGEQFYNIRQEFQQFNNEVL